MEFREFLIWLPSLEISTLTLQILEKWCLILETLCSESDTELEKRGQWMQREKLLKIHFLKPILMERRKSFLRYLEEWIWHRLKCRKLLRLLKKSLMMMWIWFGEWALMSLLKTRWRLRLLRLDLKSRVKNRFWSLFREIFLVRRLKLLKENLKIISREDLETLKLNQNQKL